MSRNENHHQTSPLQQWLENIWYHQGKGALFLLPLSALYCAINRFQRWQQTRQTTPIPKPVIVVGNITVGGTGKTPLTIHIINTLKAEGLKPAIITRGYGGQASEWPQWVSENSDPILVGDEAVLMASRTHVPVVAGANRLQSIQVLLEKHDIDVIVSDDGLQHYQLSPDLKIAVVDAKRGFGNGYCLPAGPLREKKERLITCDFIVSNGEMAQKTAWFSMHFQAQTLINLKTKEAITIQQFKEKHVNAITGIGNPQRFFETLTQADFSLQTRVFPDHHAFKASDFDVDNNNPILMTEKDAVKCRPFATKQMWYVPINAVLDEAFDTQLMSQLQKSIKSRGGVF